jgi:tetratricopeptide (TPR) repeat protein
LGADDVARGQFACLADLGRGDLAAVAGKLVKRWKFKGFEESFEESCEGHIFSAYQQYQEAIVSYNRAIKLNPINQSAWSGKAAALSVLGQWKEALDSCEKAIELKSDDYNVWVLRCIAVGNIHSYQEEIKVYSAAFECIHPEIHPEGWGQLKHRIGRIHHKEGINQQLNYRSDPHIYYDRALTHYNNALQTLTREEFPKLRLDILIDTAKIYLAQDDKDAAYQYKTEAFDILRDLLNAQPPEGKKRLQIEYHNLQQLDVDLFIANGDNINALFAAELEKNNRLTWLLSALAETTISPSYVQMRQLLGIKSASTTLNIRGLDLKG